MIIYGNLKPILYIAFITVHGVCSIPVVVDKHWSNISQRDLPALRHNKKQCPYMAVGVFGGQIWTARNQGARHSDLRRGVWWSEGLGLVMGRLSKESNWTLQSYLLLCRFPFVQSGRTDQSVLKWAQQFSELVLARMALFMNQSNSVLPREFGELWREKCTRAPWTFPFKLARTGSFRPARTDRWKATVVNVSSCGRLLISPAVSVWATHTHWVDAEII